MGGDALLLPDVVVCKALATGRTSMMNSIVKGNVGFVPNLKMNMCRNKQSRDLRCSYRDSLRFNHGCRELEGNTLGAPRWYVSGDRPTFDFQVKRRLTKRKFKCRAGDIGAGKDDDADSADEKADSDEGFRIEEEIPSTSDGFIKQVSSPAYDLRRKLEQTLDSSSYDVLDSNPWRDDSKSLYVLAQEDERLLTMRTRRARSEVERELGLLFPKRGSRRGPNGAPRNKSPEQLTPGKLNQDSGFRMQVEDVREGVLVFEDEEEAAQYCNLLDGQGKGCLGVAELEASDVFAMCKKSNTLAVFFRRGTTPPLPNRLQQDLKARRRSLED